MKLPQFPRTPFLRGQKAATLGRALGEAQKGRSTSPDGAESVHLQYNLERPCRWCRLNRQGAAAVEFALVAPVFFLMVFGMIELGRAIMVQQVLTNAAREGARIAVLDSPTPTAGLVRETVSNYLESAGITGETVTIDPVEPTTAAYAEPVTVTVSVPFSRVTWLPTTIFVGADKNLTAETVMRRETVQ